ncbi:MAG: aspartyl protease family protein [bacterium]|nr:aspartyl protease family protein [bacterium]
MRRIVTLVFVLVLVMAANAGEAEDALARHRESIGVDARWESLETIRYSGTIASGGMEGVSDILVVLPPEKPAVNADGTCDAGDFIRGIYYRSEVTLGPLHELVLITPEGGWIAASNGEVRELAGVELADYTASLVMDALLYCHPDPSLFSVTWAGVEEVDGAPCDVLDYGPVEGGLPFHPRRYFLDSGDGSLRRITSELDGVVHVTTCSDIRDFSGLRLPSRFHTTLTGLPLVIDQTLEEVAFNEPVDPTLFLPPVAERLVFPEGVDRVRVAVEFTGDAIFVPTLVNGEPVWMILDSGATMSALSTPVAEELGIVPVGTGAGVGTGGLGEVGILEAESLTIGGLTFEEPTLATADLSGFGRHFGREWGGILGYELFARTVVEIDYAQSALTIYDPETYRPPEPEPGVTEILPLRLDEGISAVEAELDGVRGYFALDLGNLNYTTVYRPAVEEYGLEERYPDWRPQLVSGFGGANFHRLVKSGELRLGSVSVPEPLVVLSGETEGALARTREMGNIGQDVFRRFRRVTLDYPDGRLILEVGPDGLGEGVPTNRLGFTAAGGEVIVVWENSPAERAGLLAGDVILALDGAPLVIFSAIDLIEWSAAEPGTERTLAVLRDGETLDIHLTTEDLW